MVVAGTACAAAGGATPAAFTSSAQADNRMRMSRERAMGVPLQAGLFVNKPS
ncbi:SipW-dependent-type signal peptide-containing protein [Nonomuraea angiospora]|uniref:SipW-dependent-type signal peptide-containing protein n=1 Tax=Nonomuraea angiospora TaxID=46172 RepID=UPI003624439F